MFAKELRVSTSILTAWFQQALAELQVVDDVRAGTVVSPIRLQLQEQAAVYLAGCGFAGDADGLAQGAERASRLACDQQIVAGPRCREHEPAFDVRGTSDDALGCRLADQRQLESRDPPCDLRPLGRRGDRLPFQTLNGEPWGFGLSDLGCPNQARDPQDEHLDEETHRTSP